MTSDVIETLEWRSKHDQLMEEVLDDLENPTGKFMSVWLPKIIKHPQHIEEIKIEHLIIKGKNEYAREMGYIDILLKYPYFSIGVEVKPDFPSKYDSWATTLRQIKKYEAFAKTQFFLLITYSDVSEKLRSRFKKENIYIVEWNKKFLSEYM